MAKQESTRIYSVRDKADNIIALVDATNAATARSHMAKSMFEIDLASQTDLISATKVGIEVQRAGAEADPLPASQSALNGQRPAGSPWPATVVGQADPLPEQKRMES